MLDLSQIKEALLYRNLYKVSTQTGVHRNTLSAIRLGKNANPSYATVKTLSDYLLGFKA
jgi:transcriptional regulator with XRE-family HTH domain